MSKKEKQTLKSNSWRRKWSQKRLIKKRSVLNEIYLKRGCETVSIQIPKRSENKILDYLIAKYENNNP